MVESTAGRAALGKRALVRPFQIGRLAAAPHDAQQLLGDESRIFAFNEPVHKARSIVQADTLTGRVDRARAEDNKQDAHGQERFCEGAAEHLQSKRVSPALQDAKDANQPGSTQKPCTAAALVDIKFGCRKHRALHQASDPEGEDGRKVDDVHRLEHKSDTLSRALRTGGNSYDVLDGKDGDAYPLDPVEDDCPRVEWQNAVHAV
eukprot:7375618-Prymnesium_polylepis.1